MDETYWALEYTHHVGDYGEHNLEQIIAVCKTEQEAKQLAESLSSKYGYLYVVEYSYGQDISY